MLFEKSFHLDVEEERFRKHISTELDKIYLPDSVRKKVPFNEGF